jgi:hypothetical protein
VVVEIMGGLGLTKIESSNIIVLKPSEFSCCSNQETLSFLNTVFGQGTSNGVLFVFDPAPFKKDITL